MLRAEPKEHKHFGIRPGTRPGGSVTGTEGPTIKKINSRSKFSISIENFNLARKFQSLARKFHSRSNFLVFGPSGRVDREIVYVPNVDLGVNSPALILSKEFLPFLG